VIFLGKGFSSNLDRGTDCHEMSIYISIYTMYIYIYIYIYNHLPQSVNLVIFLGKGLSSSFDRGTDYHDTLFFTKDFFTKYNMTVGPRLKIQLKDRHFDTNEVMESESQAVLNSLTEHDFQDAFKNGRSSGNGAYARKGTTSRAMVASRPKVSFRPDDINSSGNYGWLCVFCVRTCAREYIYISSIPSGKCMKGILK
jgi:hypothetical protein